VGPGRAAHILYGPMFVYEAIPYRQSTERAALHRAQQLASGR
jgi:hypothetical protein